MGRGEQPANNNDDSADTHREIQQARARKEIAQATKIELTNAALEKTLISRSDAESAIRNIVVQARTALLAVGINIAPRLLNESDPIVIAQEINSEITRALGALADEGDALNSLYG